MKCSYGCDYEPTDLRDAVQHAKNEHTEARVQRMADNKAAREAKKGTKKSPPKSRPRATSVAAPIPPDGAATDTVDPDRETAPVLAKAGWRERVWGKKKEPAPKPGRERKPKTPARKRVSTAELLGSAWGGAGMGLRRFGIDPPVGRVMEFQAPAAGEVLEGLTRNTPLDRPLQYLAVRAEEAKAARDLFELPLLVMLFERANDDMRMMLEPMLRAAIRRNYVAMVPIVERMRKEEEEWRAAVATLGLAGEDPVAEMMFVIFDAPRPAPREDERQSA